VTPGDTPHERAEELAADLVGVASARLLAQGLPRAERLGALRLLGILATVADGEGRVRRPLPEVAAEFDVPRLDAVRWLDHLVRVEAVVHEGGQLVVQGREPDARGPLRLHDFLELAAGLDAPGPRVPLRRLARPAAAVLVAAALAGAVLLAPGMMRERTTPVSSTGEPLATTASTSGRSAGSTSTTSAGPAATVASPSSAAPVSTTTSTTVLDCPVGVPTLEVLDTTIGNDGRLAVVGQAVNPSTAALVIDQFTVRVTVGGVVFSAPAAEGPLLVPAGSTVSWEAPVAVVATAGTPAEVVLGDWEWAPGVPPACPSR
jgi:hypothetical protein